MVSNRCLKKLSIGLVLLLLPIFPVSAGEKTDPFSQPISSDEPIAPHGMPPLPHTVDLQSVRGSGSGRTSAGGAAERNRVLRARSAEMNRQREEEREHRRARSAEIRQQTEEKREQMLQLRNGQSGDGTKYGAERPGNTDSANSSNSLPNNAGRNAAQPHSWLDEPGRSRPPARESSLPKSDFVSTSGGSQARPVAVEKGKIENAQSEVPVSEVTQQHAQDLTLPDSVNGKAKNVGRGASKLDQAVKRVGNRAAARATSLGNRAANRALAPVRRAISAPIRF